MVTFLYPALLAALLALPLLWYILRVTPPAPRRVFFPATRLLIGLIPQDQTPSKTPWWILLLRLLMAALVILALARPVFNAADGLTGSGPVRLILDNSWAGAQNWDAQIAEASEILAQAGRAKREVYILTTAPKIGDTAPLAEGPMSGGDAQSTLRGLKPMPWPADYTAMKAVIEKMEQTSIQTLWLSHGLDEDGIKSVTDLLVRQGGLEVITPTAEKLPLLLRPSSLKITADQKQPNPIRIDVDAPSILRDNIPISVQAVGQNGLILDIQSALLKLPPQSYDFDIMETLRGDLAQFKISDRRGAGAVFLLDDQSKRRNIGIAGSPETADAATLMDDAYYIKRALEPYANITLADVSTLLAQNLPMIILPDIGAMPTETLNALETWVKNGGLLLRFSGPKMAQAQAESFLLPVPLRSGGRSLDGAMTWEKPQTIAPFPKTSPLYGLDIPPDLTIKQQILADPAQDLTGKVWAQLTDGTPLITAAPLEKGLIVLAHTSAGPGWSDLALSGLYVNILRRVTTLAGTSFTPQNTVSNAMLEPILMMDGYGSLIPPAPSVLPLPTKDAEKTIPNALHPPGLYGAQGVQFALNLGTALPKLKAIESLPSSVKRRNYNTQYELDLMPALLCAAFALFLLDWLVIIFLSGSIVRLIWKSRPALLALLLIPSLAQADDIRYAGGLYLAYIQTGESEIDSLSQTGLENLAQILEQRTSVEPDGVAVLNPETDTLAFFPLIYWPVTQNQKPVSDKALKNIQNYLDHGGTILFDTRDQSRATADLVNTQGAQSLRRIIGGLNIPPLNPIKEDHVLGRSFYLLRGYPGRFENGTLWIEQDGANGRDGVSSVLIGSNDWASAWASHSSRNTRNPQQEMAMRFGVNLMMYALTGNYKADQVHIPFILERLGK